MSTALLQELHQELRRIYIAGSELAAGDPRLKRLLPQCQQLGERAHVFQKLGQGIVALIEPSEESKGERLQEISTLLASVLRTLGTAPATGVLQSPAHQPHQLKTNSPYRKLAPVIGALTTSGGGRYDIIVEAFKDGVFNDLRLMKLAIAALEDSYSEIADYAAQWILPAYGQAIIPHMMSAFDPKGKGVNCRRLLVIAKAGGEEREDLLLQWAESGSSAVRATAIRCLTGREAYIDRLIAWTEDKQKTVREAAYHALVHCQSSEALNCMMTAFHGKDSKIVRNTIAGSSNDELNTRIAYEIEYKVKVAPRVYNVYGDEARVAEMLEATEQYFQVLRNKRVDALMPTFHYVVENAEHYARIGWLYPLYDMAAVCLNSMGTEEALDLLLDIQDQEQRYVAWAFNMAANLWSPRELYEYYKVKMTGEWLDMELGHYESIEKLIIQEMERMIGLQVAQYQQNHPGVITHSNYYEKRALIPMDELWDRRWLDWVIKMDCPAVVSMLSRPDHAGCKAYIRDKLTSQAADKLSDNRFLTLLVGFKKAKMNPEIKWEAFIAFIERESGTRYINDSLMVEFYDLPERYRGRIETVMNNAHSILKKQLKQLLESMSDNNRVQT